MHLTCDSQDRRHRLPGSTALTCVLALPLVLGPGRAVADDPGSPAPSGCELRAPDLEALVERDPERAAAMLMLGGGLGRQFADHCPPAEVVDLEVFPASALGAQEAFLARYGSRDTVFFYMRLDGFADEAAAAAFVSEALARYAETLAPLGPLHRQDHHWSVPTAWPLHPSSPNRADDPLAGTVTWWPEGIPTVDHLDLVQAPAVFEPCNNGRARGMVAWSDGTSAYVHQWTWQHFFPNGGCGG
jgi:hypothetical protein